MPLKGERPRGWETQHRGLKRSLKGLTRFHSPVSPPAPSRTAASIGRCDSDLGVPIFPVFSLVVPQVRSIPCWKPLSETFDPPHQGSAEELSGLCAPGWRFTVLPGFVAPCSHPSARGLVLGEVWVGLWCLQGLGTLRQRSLQMKTDA